MDKLAKVSVIVPVFNAGAKLVPSIESLLKQTLKDIEIIIVNDASTDNSGCVIDKLARENSNIVPVHISENKGVHEARLAGLKKSTAPWIGFLDADDFARPKMFEALLSTAKENNVDIVICGSDRVSENRKFKAPKVRFRRSEKISSKLFPRFCAFEFGTGTLWNKLFSREAIEPYFDLHFPWRQSINEDLILNIGCFYQAKSIYLLSEILHEYVYHDGSVTSQSLSEKAYVDTFRAFALAMSVFNDFSEDAKNDIVNMYRAQLSWNSYQVDDVRSLNEYGSQVAEAARLIAETNPSALGFLSARRKSEQIGIRYSLRSVIHQIKVRAINKSVCKK